MGGVFERTTKTSPRDGSYQRRRADDLARIMLAREKRDVLRTGRGQATPQPCATP
jgi:hypothetical protein